MNILTPDPAWPWGRNACDISGEESSGLQGLVTWKSCQLTLLEGETSARSQQPWTRFLLPHLLDACHELSSASAIAIAMTPHLYRSALPWPSFEQLYLCINCPLLFFWSPKALLLFVLIFFLPKSWFAGVSWTFQSLGVCPWWVLDIVSFVSLFVHFYGVFCLRSP